MEKDGASEDMKKPPKFSERLKAEAEKVCPAWVSANR